MRSWSAAVLGLLFVLTLALTLNTHRIGLWEPTEARYADIAWRMVETGDWWTPHFNGLIHLHKPAAAYWPPAAALLLLGHHPWAPRISSLVLGLLCVLLTYSWGRRMWSQAHGFIASMTLGTTLLFSAQARLLSADSPLTAAVLVALWAAWEILLGESNRKRWAWIYWLSLGAGFAVKGPVALILGLLPALLYAVAGSALGTRLARDQTLSARDLLGRLHWKWGAFVFAAVAMPWFISMSIQHRGLLDYFLENQVVGRVASTVHHRPGPVYYFVGILLGGFFPWSAVLVWSLTRHLRRPWSAWKLWSFCVWGPSFLIFSLSGSKLPAYLLPLFPLWSLQSARSILDAERPPSSVIVITGILLILGGGIIGSLLAFPGATNGAFTQAPVPVSLVGAALLVGGLIVVLELRSQQRRPLGWVMTTAGAWLIALALGSSALPALTASGGTTLEMGRTARAFLAENPDGRVIAYRCQPASLSFYTSRPFRMVGVRREVDFIEADQVSKYVLPLSADLDSLNARGNALWVIKRKREEELRGRLSAPLREIVREGRWGLYRTVEASD